MDLTYLNCYLHGAIQHYPVGISVILDKPNKPFRNIPVPDLYEMYPSFICSRRSIVQLCPRVDLPGYHFPSRPPHVCAAGWPTVTDDALPEGPGPGYESHMLTEWPSPAASESLMLCPRSVFHTHLSYVSQYISSTSFVLATIR